MSFDSSFLKTWAEEENSGKIFSFFSNAKNHDSMVYIDFIISFGTNNINGALYICCLNRKIAAFKKILSHAFLVFIPESVLPCFHYILMHNLTNFFEAFISCTKDGKVGFDFLFVVDREGNSPLHISVKKNYERLVRSLLTSGANVLHQNVRNGQTCLHYMAYCNNKHILIEMLKKSLEKKNINDLIRIRDLSGRYFAHFFSEKNCFDMLRDFFNYIHFSRMDSNERKNLTKFLSSIISCADAHGITPLFYAIQNKNILLIDLLLQRGAKPLIVNHKNGNAILHYAVESGNIEIVNFLLTRIQEPMIMKLLLFENLKHEVPIHFSARNGFLDITKLILNCCPNLEYKCIISKMVDRAGFMPMHLAAYFGHLEILELFEPLVSMETSNIYSKKNALHYAVAQGHERLVDFLLPKIGTHTLFTMIIPGNRNPLSNTLLIDAIQKGFLTIVEKLLEVRLSFEPKPHSAEWHDLMSAAIIQQNEDIVKLVSKYIKHQDLEDLFSYTKKNIRKSLLCQAVKQNHLRIVNFLFEAGAASSLIDKNDVAYLICICIRSKHQEILESIVKSLSSEVFSDLLNWRDENTGNSILHQCVLMKNPKATKFFIEKGADVNVINNFSISSISYAALDPEQKAIFMALAAKANNSFILEEENLLTNLEKTSSSLNQRLESTGPHIEMNHMDLNLFEVMPSSLESQFFSKNDSYLNLPARSLSFSGGFGEMNSSMDDNHLNQSFGSENLAFSLPKDKDSSVFPRIFSAPSMRICERNPVPIPTMNNILGRNPFPIPPGNTFERNLFPIPPVNPFGRNPFPALPMSTFGRNSLTVSPIEEIFENNPESLDLNLESQQHSSQSNILDFQANLSKSQVPFRKKSF